MIFLRNQEEKNSRKAIYIGFVKYKFDPKIEEPSVPEELQLSEEALGKYQYHLIQLIGPVRSEWLREMKHLGVESIEYIPKFTYLVKVDPDSLPSIRNLKYVRWSGIYQPAYKVSESLEERTGIIKNVSILIYDDGNVPQVLDQLKSLNASVLDVRRLQKSKTVVFQNIIVKVDADKIPEIAKIPSVRWLEYISPVPIHEDEKSCQIIAGNTHPSIQSGYRNWLSTLDVDGSDEKIAVADTGFDTNDPTDCHQDVMGRLTDIIFYYSPSNHDTDGHGTHVAGIALGNASIGTTDGNFLHGLGVAPSANLIVLAHRFLQSMSTYTRDAITRGATVLNCSWGEGNAGMGYTNNSMELDMCVRNANPATTDDMEPLIIVMSAGNEGWHEKWDYFHENPGAPEIPNWGYRDQSITTPKEAKNIIVVGATENYRTATNVEILGVPPYCIGVEANNHRDLAFCSSRGPGGPTGNDKRILPTIVAPGMIISSLRSQGVRPNNAIDDDYVWMCGTSMAAAHVSGAVALISEWWRKFNANKIPSPAMVKALLINGAVDLEGYERGGEPHYIKVLDGTEVWRSETPLGGEGFTPQNMGHVPSFDQGWGLINLSNIINNGPAIYKDQTTTLSEGQNFTITVAPAEEITRPLKITLVWSDAPATPGFEPILLNDIDLEVTEINTGNLYKGNWFPNPSLDGNSTGWSVCEINDKKDNINNVECVYIQTPVGKYEVKIICTELLNDGIPPYADEFYPDEFRQDFALVISNAIIPTDNPVDVILAIDRTGSMKTWGYLEPARERGKEFVDMMEINDYIGIVSFAYVPASCTSAPVYYREKKAYTEFDLQRINVVGIIDNAKNAIDGIRCESGRPTTSIGAGLQEAQSQLNNNGSPAPDSIVLVSDGFENHPPSVSEVMLNIPNGTNGTKIYTISLGEHSARELLEQIANDRGGKYFHAAGSLEIAECYYRIKGAVTGESISMLESCETNTDEDPTHIATVDACSKTATFAVSWVGRENTLDLKLEDPNGNHISCKAPYVQFKEGATYKLYIVSSPIPGKWKLHITAENTVTSPVHYTTVAFLNSSLKIQTFLPKGQKLVTGKPIVLGTRILCNEKPVVDAQVTANITFLEKSVKNQLEALSGILKNIELVKGVLRIEGEFLEIIDQSKVKAIAAKVSSMKDTIPEDLVKLRILQKLVQNKAVKLAPQLKVAMAPFKPIFPLVRTRARKLHHAGDGVYLDYFTQTDVEGPHIFRINAVGYTETCSWFSRNDAIAVNVPKDKEVAYAGPMIKVAKLPATKKLIELGFPKKLVDKLKKTHLL